MKSFAVVFPGQGSQNVGMLADIAAIHPEVHETFAQASAVLPVDLWALVQKGPACELNKTIYTQPALLAASYAIWKILNKSFPMKPAFLAGHSLGEYTALVCSQSLDYQDAIKLVYARGQFMQAAVPEGTGGMAAIIGLDEQMVKEICEQAVVANEVLSPANFNSIGQIVIAGHKQAVERALLLAKEKGAKLAVLLPVSVPSHCELMRPAAERLQSLLDETVFQVPNIPVLGNADVTLYTNADSIKIGLTKQLYMPVQWIETIQFFVRMGVQTLIECGPGKVLTGLNKRIGKDLNLVTTGDATSLNTFSERGY